MSTHVQSESNQLSRLDIPGFEVLERIGSGGMAVVWQARQLSLDRIVAIKVLSSHLSADADDIERFKTEAQAEAKLKHPGIVQVYDANVEAGLCYIVQEFVDGYSVGDWIRRKGALSEEDALLVAGYITDALAYAWETAGVIHCDIKPDNILIDADGSPKVTDLGLARTISAMTDDRVSNEVMGTPAYMSPEQIQGFTNLDCRTDIYSLGAMLYQCITGKMLFQGNAEEAVMEKQLGEQVPAPQEVSKELSSAVCGLVEKMLAKDRDDRYQDWETVRIDITRAKSGLPPVEPLKKAGLSTVEHTPMPLVVHAPTGALHAKRPQKRHSPLLPVLATLMAGIVGVMAGMWGYGKLMERVAPEEVEATGDVPAATTRSVRSADKRPQKLLEQARKWRADNPGDYQGAENCYRRVMVIGAGTEFAQRAADELEQMRAEREEMARAVVQELTDRVAPMVEREEFLEAAQVYIDYDGTMAVETADTRAQRAAELRTRHEDMERRDRMAEVEQREWKKTVLDDVAAALLTDGLAEGQRILRDASAEAVDEDQALSLSKLDQILADAADTDTEIVESFVAQAGQVVEVAMKAGTRKVKVVGAKDGVVYARLVTSVNGVSVELQIHPSDLAAGERLARMGSDDDPDVALAKGLMAWRAGAMDYARRFWGQTDPMISDRLVASVNERSATDSEKEAETDLIHLLRSLGLPFEDSYSKEVALIQLRSISLNSSDGDRVEMAVARYRQQHGETVFGRENDVVLRAVLEAVGMAALKESRYKTGLKATDALTVGTVMDALRAANPNLANHEVIISESNDDKITAIQIESSELRDLSPLGACSDLMALTLACPGLRDLSGISGVPLISLSILESDVQDISALRRMPLTELQIEESPVRDLIPLRGKSLATLSVANTRVGDLRGLMGMPLVKLDISGTPVKRLDFLRRMPLEEFSLAGTKVSDLSLVRSLPVKRLDASETMIKDLSFVTGSQIEDLTVSRTAVGSLSGLRGSNVRALYINGTRLRSLTGLDGVNLEHLDISDTEVSNLEPLRGLPLRSLAIDSTPVRNLDVLRSLPIVHLSCRNLGTSDYSALKGLRIESISIADLASARDILKTMPNLTVVNGFEIRAGAVENRDEDRAIDRRPPIRKPGGGLRRQM
ncbi:MAG: protein kinase [Kiritimatiellae bacterium]|nr:protein kinase [Kiritimatiellia bacterium]